MAAVPVLARDKVCIDGLKIDCIIGCNSSERVAPQRVVLDIALFVDTTKCGATDDICDTVNYSAITKRVVALCKESRCFTLERLCALVAQECLMCDESRGKVVRARICIKKPDVLAAADWPSVEIERDAAFFASSSDTDSEWPANGIARSVDSEPARRCSADSDTTGAAETVCDALMADLRERLSDPASLLMGGSPAFSAALASVKNKGARTARPSALVEAASVDDVQAVIRWASRFGATVSVVGGGHSEHCCVSSPPGGLVVALTLRRLASVQFDGASNTLRVGGGVTAGAIEAAAAEHGRCVPLGSRPSVGFGLTLLGGMGHLTRSLGFACDSLLAAQIVLPGSGEVVEATDASHPQLMRALRGAGSQLGAVVAATLRTHPFPVDLRLQSAAPVPVPSLAAALRGYFALSSHLPHTGSLDLYARARESSDADVMVATQAFLQAGAGVDDGGAFHGGSVEPAWFIALRGAASSPISTYEQLFVSELHATFPRADRDFKRSVLIAESGLDAAAAVLDQALSLAPTPLCYLHIVHCGGAAASPSLPSVMPRAWQWALVITGRCGGLGGSDDNEVALAAVRGWVHATVQALLRSAAPAGGSAGVYPADLGPSSADTWYAGNVYTPADSTLLAGLKARMDPHGVLAHTIQPATQHLCAVGCDAPPATAFPHVVAIIALSGRRFSGKDYAAEELARHLNSQPLGSPVAARVCSISDGLKRAYAAATGVPLQALLDRVTKDAHRPALTAFHAARQEARGPLADFRSLEDVLVAASADAASSSNSGGDTVGPTKPVVLLVTGMREAAVLTHLRALPIPTLAVRVHASDACRAARGWEYNAAIDDGPAESALDGVPVEHWDAVLTNDAGGNGAIAAFAAEHVAPFVALALARRLGAGAGATVAAIAPVGSQPSPAPTCTVPSLPVRIRLATRCTPGFPAAGVFFRDVLGIAHRPALMRDVVAALAAAVASVHPLATAVVAVESGGPVFAAPVALQLGLPLVLLRKCGVTGPARVPPPALRVAHAGSNASRAPTALEIGVGGIGAGDAVVLVDDTLATGATAAAALALVHGLGARVAGVAVVLEFPAHGGAARIQAAARDLGPASVATTPAAATTALVPVTSLCRLPGL